MSCIDNSAISAHTTNVAEIEGIKELWAETLGDPSICVAILDGPVDRSHPSLARANLTNVDILVPSSSHQGPATKHGTNVASVLLGQHDGPFLGIAPRCRGLMVPIFKDGAGNSLAPCSQLDLARAISEAVQEGAHIINISAGDSSFSGAAHPILAGAVRNCTAEGVLIVAATGNEGCDCLHVPAALPAVLAVGAMDSQGEPLEFSNWSKSYEVQGILAPGENILGATPGGGITANSGTSYATAIVSGIAALLLSLQLKRGQMPDPYAVRAALVSSAVGGDDLSVANYHLLAGRLNVKGAMSKILEGGTVIADSTERPETVKMLTTDNADSRVAAGHTPEAQVRAATPDNEDSKSSNDTHPAPVESVVAGKASGNPSGRGDVLLGQAKMLACSCGNEVCSCGGSSNSPKLVYALGQLGYDFGTEARRDSIMQHMKQTANNPYDHKQMLAYLDENLSDAGEIIWTLNLDQTTIYAIGVEGPFATQISERLRQFLRQQIEEGVERISVPGRIVGSKRLFTGQVVPVIHPVLRGMYSWTTKALVKSIVGSATGAAASKKSDMINNFLLRIYHELRNLGMTPRERALNYSATNAMLVSRVFEQALAEAIELDTIEAERSPICRPDSDCWDVKLTFFDPGKVFERARRVYRFTVDISDTVPVMVGEVRSWSVR
ncbi:MAG: PatA/PatG family cyanobactin maturation protease [Thermoproteota archaeon]|nr:PatA/PatG family cyanobactin maturation protease [Thermoproteota archaeon]MDQ3966972.1 PatA/PatG family cyanobactin maturation protease [Thermoproteota archaeon]